MSPRQLLLVSTVLSVVASVVQIVGTALATPQILQLSGAGTWILLGGVGWAVGQRRKARRAGESGLMKKIAGALLTLGLGLVGILQWILGVLTPLALAFGVWALAVGNAQRGWELIWGGVWNAVAWLVVGALGLLFTWLLQRTTEERP